jgi:hypothetical protein
MTDQAADSRRLRRRSQGVNDAGAQSSMRKESQGILNCFGLPSDSPVRARHGVYDLGVFGPPGQRVRVILPDTRYFPGPLLWEAPPLPALEAATRKVLISARG